MKSIWDHIFNPKTTGKPLTDRENEEALNELAKASLHVEKLQTSPEHGRILELIQDKIQQQQSR